MLEAGDLSGAPSRRWYPVLMAAHLTGLSQLGCLTGVMQRGYTEIQNITSLSGLTERLLLKRLPG